MSPDEFAAAEVIASIRGGRVGAPSGRHDADIGLHDGTTIGVEVTRAADSAESAAWSEISRRRVQGDDRLSRWWSVGISTTASVKRAHLAIPPLLAALEHLGSTEHRWLAQPGRAAHQNPMVAHVDDQLAGIGVVFAAGHRVARHGQPGYSFVVHRPGGAIASSDVTDAVIIEATKPDNLDKLTLMHTEERHLFVWIDDTAGGAWTALRSLFTPLPQITVPSPATTVWVAARTSDRLGAWIPDVVHSITPPAGWVWHCADGETVTYPRLLTLVDF